MRTKSKKKKRKKTEIRAELKEEEEEEEEKLLCNLWLEKVGVSNLFTKGFTVKNIDAMDKVVS